MLPFFADTSFKYWNSHKLDPLPGNFLWTDDAITLYTENIQSQIFKNRIIDFIITDFRDSNLITDSFISVLQDCAKQSAKLMNKVPTQKIRKSNNLKNLWKQENQNNQNSAEVTNAWRRESLVWLIATLLRNCKFR